MKIIISYLLVASIFCCIISCSRDSSLSPSEQPFKTESLFANFRKSADDTSGFNYNMHGQFLFRHLKYYLGTVDPLTFLPESQRVQFKSSFNETNDNFKKEKFTHGQIIDNLVDKKSFSHYEGELIKEHHQSLLDFISTKPTPQLVWDWFDQKEKEIIKNPKLSQGEKSRLLDQRAMVKYTLLWCLEQKNNDVGGTPNSRIQACGFWEKLSCYVGNISGLSGLGGSIGGSIGLFKNTSGSSSSNTSTADPVALGSVVGIVLGLVQSFATCQCNGSDLSICDAPISISYPYKCYLPGDNIQVTAVGYGTIPPTQFTWNFYYNDDLNNALFSNASGVNYIYLPGPAITQHNTTDFAVKIQSHCASNGVTPQQDIPSQVFGWINLSDLGRPYFTISGTDNMTLSQVQTSSYFMYGIAGAYSQTNATVSWDLIPSGYPNYSATGVFTNTYSTHTTGSYVQVKWNPTPGFATLKCTTSSYCNGTPISEVQYFNVHIQ